MERAVPVVLFLGLLALPQSAGANTIHCGAGDVACLIAAINHANANPNLTNIRLAGGTYLLTSVDNNNDGPSGLPSIVTPVIIRAGRSGATLERAAGAPEFRILHVARFGSLVIDGITLRGGTTPFGTNGGALLNARGTVAIVNCQLDHNTTRESGGAVFNQQGFVAIIDSTISENEAGFTGGGLYNQGGVLTMLRAVLEGNVGRNAIGGLSSTDGDVFIVQSQFIENFGGHDSGGIQIGSNLRSKTAVIAETTFLRNRADGGGALSAWGQLNVVVRDSAFVENRGGVVGSGAITNGATMTVTNTTFARHMSNLPGCPTIAINNVGVMNLVNNTFAENAAGALCSEFRTAPLILSFDGATTRLQNTLVAHDTANGLSPICQGTVTSLGHNLLSDSTDCTIALQPTDLIGEAHLGALIDDGTPGNAHFPLLPGSPAIDRGNDAACSKEDQIGQRRRRQCDIGAIESRPAPSH